MKQILNIKLILHYQETRESDIELNMFLVFQLYVKIGISPSSKL